MCPYETPIVSSLQMRLQSRVPVEGARTATLGSSWWQHNARLSAKSPSSDWPTPVKRPPFWDGQTPSMRRSSSEITHNNGDNTTDIVIFLPPYATNSWRPLRTPTSPPSSMRLRDTPAQQCSSCSAIYMTTTPGYWPRTSQIMTQSWGKPSTPTIRLRASVWGSTSA